MNTTSQDFEKYIELNDDSELDDSLHMKELPQKKGQEASQPNMNSVGEHSQSIPNQISSIPEGAGAVREQHADLKQS